MCANLTLHTQFAHKYRDYFPITQNKVKYNSYIYRCKPTVYWMISRDGKMMQNNQITLWEQGVVGSNPATPTVENQRVTQVLRGSLIFICIRLGRFAGFLIRSKRKMSPVNYGTHSQ